MEEYLDIVDENGDLTGARELRRVAHENGLWHRTVHVYFYRVVSGEIELLVHLRSKLKSSSPNRWDPRFGGHVEAGQTVEETVVKEALEEVGIEISLADLIVGAQRNHDGGNNKEVVNPFYYEFKGDIESLSFDDGEVQEVRWMSIPEIKKDIERNPDGWNSSGRGFDAIISDIKGSKASHNV